MSKDAPSPSKRYVVVPRTPALGAAGVAREPLLELLQQAASAGLGIVKVVGPPEHPRRLVITASPEQVSALQARYRSELLIEEDQSLFPMTKRPDRTGHRKVKPAMTRPPRSERPETEPDSASGERPVKTGRKRYLVAPRRAGGVELMSAGAMDNIRNTLEKLGGEVLAVKKSRPSTSPLAALSQGPSELYVVSMDEDQVATLQAARPPTLIIEEDASLSYGETSTPLPPQTVRRLGVSHRADVLSARDIRVRVVGDNNTPVANTRVMLEGDGFPAEGLTDQAGEATIKLVTIGDGEARSLFIDPERDFWTRYVLSPALSSDRMNIIQLDSLKSTVRSFPEGFRHGWGQMVMGLHLLPPDVDGRGAKVAIIDSGADTSHPLLSHIRKGQNFTELNGVAGSTWTDDVVGHGSHCAGVIAARGAPGLPFRGFAPEAEIHVLRIFPGGRFSSLLDALDYCIDNGIDVVNMSLGSPQASEVVEQKLTEVVDAGIACIVAAGNSGGPVQYPASSPNAFAVAAIGKVNEFPPASWDAQQMVPQLTTPEGLFSPSFTCHGAEVKVCAPGVAIISTVPGNGFDAQSGTSMAAPHVTGLAALLFAHHPALRGLPRNRARVSHALGLIASSCVPVALGAGRAGYGLPRLAPLIADMAGASRPAWAGPGASQSVATASVIPPASADLLEQLAPIIENAVARALKQRGIQVGGNNISPSVT